MAKFEGVVICIPVHNINKKMGTLDKLKEQRNIKSKVAIFCDAGQKEFFKYYCKPLLNYEVIECKGLNRWQKRQYMLDYAKENKYKYMIGLDDDLLTVLKRDSIKEKVSQTPRLSLKSVFTSLLFLLKDGAAIASTVSQFGQLNKGNNVVNMRRPTPFCAYDIEKIVKKANDVEFRDVELEDICFWYELISRGLLIQCLTNVQTAFNYVPDTIVDGENKIRQNDLLKIQMEEIGFDNFDVDEVLSIMRRYKPKYIKNVKAYNALKEF